MIGLTDEYGPPITPEEEANQRLALAEALDPHLAGQRAGVVVDTLITMAVVVALDAGCDTGEVLRGVQEAMDRVLQGREREAPP